MTLKYGFVSVPPKWKSVFNRPLIDKLEGIFSSKSSSWTNVCKLILETRILRSNWSDICQFPEPVIVNSSESISSSDLRHPYSFKPNLFIEISKELPYKLRALAEYKNEIKKFPHPRSKKSLEAMALRWGSLYGYNAAEAFEIIFSRSKKLQF